ncbi:ABC transporter ATP-binding protein [Oceanobacillus manasiensis]|uniref:ABC transporter ATP-binding protein n=1 Tax=Oceanobacillus manasiensis TaxID=586413 RepID=UPI0005AAB8C1|nr:ABC transporter ATP-binding protein [Oceanobacillus manasiensis]
MIEFDKVKKVYPDGTEAISDFSLKVEPGEIVTLIGPSGCGKTTAMKMVNRLIEPSAGDIYINERKINSYNINELRWNIGYVLQEIALFPHMTIGENISVVPEMKKWKKNKVKNRIDDLLEMVGLDPVTYQKRMPRELSGGQQQRIGVVRALAADPDIILMDEPFSALDPISREQLQTDIRTLQKEIKKTILFVTHDMDEAMALGDRVCLMKDGKIVQFDTPQQLILNPKTEFVKNFIGERKSPWQTAVDVICDQSKKRVITKENVEQGEFEPHLSYIVTDENSMYQATVSKGSIHDEFLTLENDLPLYKAAGLMEQNENQELFPVVKQGKFIGVLSNKIILDYLRSKTTLENGVIQ